MINLHANDIQLINMLPGDGMVNYFGKVCLDETANFMFDHLLTHIPWKNDEVIIAGKKMITKRKVAWYATSAMSYSYSNTTKTALIFTPFLFKIKQEVEKITGYTYNACLLNLYHSGAEGMAYHSDNEKQLDKQAGIACLSIGAQRKFLFKHKTTKQNVGLMLENGSLLLMHAPTQQYWQHRLPLTTKVTKPRISLTFRKMVE